jgi:hypothetical protein
MWIPAGVIYQLATLALGAGWLRAIERQMRRQASRTMVKGAWLGQACRSPHRAFLL